MPGNTRCKPLFYSLLLLLAFGFSTAVRAEEEDGAVSLRSVFIYNFLNYVTWPDVAGSKKLCVYGNNAIADTLDRIRKKQQQAGTSFTVQRLNNPEEAGSCQILYLDSSLGTSRITSIAISLGKQAVLTISDVERFSSENGIVSLIEKDNKPHISINEQRAHDAGLKVSSRLLSIAEVIKN